MLKTSLHVHVQGDHDDYITYTPCELLDRAEKLGFNVIAFTSHKRVIYTKKISDYARRKNILLIPGIEVNLGGHVLILNADHHAQELKTLDDLRAYKKERPEIFTIAAHPFFPKNTRRRLCLKEKINKNMDLFDGIEHSWFYSKNIDFNKKARALAEKHNIPYIATADVHRLEMLENDHIMIKAEKNMESILEALREKRFINVTNGKSLFGMLSTFGKMQIDGIKRFLPWFPPHIVFEHEEISTKNQRQNKIIKKANPILKII